MLDQNIQHLFVLIGQFIDKGVDSSHSVVLIIRLCKFKWLTWLKACGLFQL